jgi:hypothetical protein
MAKIREAEDKIYRGAELTSNYFHAKHASVQQQTEVKQQLAVVRVPEPISDTQRWLEAHRPKNIDIDQPPASPALAPIYREMREVDEALAAADKVIEDMDDTITRLNKRMMDS